MNRTTKTAVFLGLFALLLTVSGCGWFVAGGVAGGIYLLSEAEKNSAPAVTIANP